MEWTYRITKPFTINRRPLFAHELAGTNTEPFSAVANAFDSTTWADMAFSPGEIDEVLYCCLAKGYPDCVERIPKNELIAAVWRARGLA